ncbi:MAG: HlyD family efflux transporter periplasmic adaptor subunit [Muribaculum sp.]|nr:HlyD family efflux transporter periplasmic adaptor subunit [Muribaculum sp.]
MDREIPKEERLKARRMKWIKVAAVVIGVVALFIIVFSSLRKSVKMTDLKFSDVERSSIETSISASGKVVPAFEEIINSPISTRIVEVYCQNGDSVGEGTPLLRLDLQSAETELNKLTDEMNMKQLAMEQTRLNISTYLRNLEMQVQVKEMSVNRLEAEVKNERRLDSLGSGTGDKVREAELAYNTGKLELQQLRQQLVNERQVKDAEYKSKQLELSIFEKNLSEQRRTLEDAKVKSPRAATLTYINKEIGSQISQGQKLAVVSDLSHFSVDAEIADSYGERVSIGSPANVKIGKDVLRGKVTNVAPLSNNGVISFTIKLDDDDYPRLRSGLKTDVYVMCDIKDDVLRIRNGSYYMGPGNYELFVADGDNEIVKRKVKLGDSNYEYVEVVDGLKPGDRVVISDMSDFKNSNKVKIRK